MVFEIIKGRNQGYPCIPELNECESAKLISPVNEYMFFAGSGEYPVIVQVPAASAKLEAPFPEYMMTCFGENVNGGFLWLGRLKAIRNRTESELYNNGRKIRRMYFNENSCKTAYCNGLRVFETFCERTEIV